MWLYPSRGRPAECAALIASMVDCGSMAPGVVVINDDDSKLSTYRKIILPPGWEMMAIPPGYIGLGEKLRRAFDLWPLSNWYGWLADDVSVVTHGFEQALVAAAGAWGVAGGNDLWLTHDDVDKTRILSGVTVIGGDLARSIGYLVPPGFTHLFVDDVWETVARELRNWHFLPTIVTPNNHPGRTGAAPHAVTAAVNARQVYEADKDQFQAWLTNEAPVVISRARDAMWDIQGLSLDRARKSSVMIGVPCYRDVAPEHYSAGVETVSLFMALGIRCELKIVKGGIVHQARSAICNAFLKTSHTDLLFIDDDMSWKPWDAVRLLASPHPLIAAIGRKKSTLPDNDMLAWCWSAIETEDGSINMDAAGSIEVGSVGTGLMRIHRSVLETMATAHPEWRRRSNIADDPKDQKYYIKFFAWNDRGEDEVSEDIGFCDAWRALGGQVWADPTIAMNHYGIKPFGGCINKYLQRS